MVAVITAESSAHSPPPLPSVYEELRVLPVTEAPQVRPVNHVRRTGGRQSVGD